MPSLRLRPYFKCLCNSRRFFILFFLSLFFSAKVQVKAQDTLSSVVTKTISYTTTKASEVYLVWTINYWHIPDKKLWPPGTYLKDNCAYTKMQKKGNSFYTSISLPYGTRSDFYFWMPLDNKGRPIEGWDVKSGSSYTANFTDEQGIQLNDSKLQIVKGHPFSLLTKGKWILACSFVLFLVAWLWIRKIPRLQLFLLSFAVFTSATLFTLFARTGIIKPNWSQLLQSFGIFGSDLAWLGLMAIIFALLFYSTRQNKPLSILVFTCFVVITGLSVLISLLNIEVVKQLGTPFTYKWLYYSDFLRGNDAKTGAAKTLTGNFILNVASILGGFVFLALAFYLFLLRIQRRRYLLYTMTIAFILLTAVSYGSYRIGSLKRSKTQAPVFAFVSSVINPSSRKKLEEQKLSAEAVNYIAAFHSHSYTTALPFEGNNAIDNIIVFVSESTPARYISVYDSNANYTPNLKRWMNIGASYSNMYAHIPSTPNSFISLVSGVYPMLDFRSALNENIRLPRPSLPEILVQNGWNTSLFFSSDLKYAGMGDYAQNQEFKSVRDRATIACAQQFSTTKTEIDGVNDNCTVTSYLNWLDQNANRKNFSVLWTNQTHSPYYGDNSIVFSKGNDNLNMYLNALHHTDSVFNYMMEELDKRGKLKTSLVVFIADHGEAFGTHNQTLHASRVYEENVHIPCMLFNPVLFDGANSKKVAGLIDVPPTLTQLLGIQKPEAWEGRSLFENQAADRSFFVSPYTDLIIGTRHNNWKYIFNVDTEEPELYDLDKDPLELSDVSGQYPEIVKKEHEVLIAWFQYVESNYSHWQEVSKKK